jgi:hypothetical protein
MVKIFILYCLDNQNNVNLKFLRNIISLYSKNLKLNESVNKIISKYHLIDAIKSAKFRNDNFYDEVLNSDEFCSFITGKGVKSLLFEDTENIENKRYNTEEYYKVK